MPRDCFPKMSLDIHPEDLSGVEELGEVIGITD
jgi:hypothetical protein